MTAMNFAEAISYIYSLGNEVLTMKLGLETVQALAAALDNPQQKFPAIHIAGTNGKGSTAAMTAAILRAANYRVGLYISPNLISLVERYQVNGQQISENDFARLATNVRQAGERLVADGKLPAPPTFFEQVTMIAYLHFAERKVDLAVLEVGMGGRLDATNICRPVVTAITPIGLDHQQYLGDTLAAIAGEKAGIIKPNVPLVVAAQPDEAMQAIAARAAELNAPLISVADQPSAIEADNNHDLQSLGRYRLRYQGCNAHLNLRGRHQTTNAMTAIRIVEQLNQAGWKIEKTAIEKGLSSIEWPARLQLIQSQMLPAPLLLDGAHNPAGAQVLWDFLNDHCQEFSITMIFGAMQDKALTEIAEILFPAARQVILTKVKNARAAAPEKIAELIGNDQFTVVCTDSIAEALAEAARGIETTATASNLIVACGSLYLAGELLKHLAAGEHLLGDQR